jgi:RNAse (barnase) inhibitor barstar
MSKTRDGRPDWRRDLADWLDNDEATVRLSTGPDAELVSGFLDRHGLDALIVDLSTVRDKPGLMRTFQHDLNWPAWFGANWDALADLLSGPEDRTARYQVLILAGWDGFQRNHEDLATTLIDLIEESSADPDSLLTGALLLDAGHPDA